DPRHAPSGGDASGVGVFEVDSVGEVGSTVASPQLLRSSPRASVTKAVLTRTRHQVQRGCRPPYNRAPTRELIAEPFKKGRPPVKQTPFAVLLVVMMILGGIAVPRGLHAQAGQGAIPPLSTFTAPSWSDIPLNPNQPDRVTYWSVDTF